MKEAEAHHPHVATAEGDLHQRRAIDQGLRRRKRLVRPVRGRLPGERAAGPVDEGVDEVLLAQAPDQTDEDGREREQAAHLRHPPAPGRDLPAHHREGQRADDEDNLLRKGERRGLLGGGRVAVLEEVLRVGRAPIRDDGALRVTTPGNPPMISTNSDTSVARAS